MSNSRIPLLSTDLIDELDKLYPERCPEITHHEREIWMLAGERRLVRRLLQLRKEDAEENNPLTQHDDEESIGGF